MHIVLTSLGTSGDVFPFIGLGRQFVERGHAVSLATSGHYRAVAAENGFEFHEIISREEIDSVLGNPDFWRPLKAGRLASEWGTKFIADQFARLAELAQRAETVLVANPGVLAARLAHEKLGTPLASMVLQPWVLPSVHRPPIIPGGLGPPSWAPRCVWKLYSKLLNAYGDHLVGPALNSLRAELNLAPVKGLFDWWLSPQLIVGLFPEWFGPRQPDWPPHLRILSFPLFDGTSRCTLPPEVTAFLEAGDPPVAITFGTGMRHGAELYGCAVEACSRLGLRSLAITGFPEQLALAPTPTHRHAAFASFGELFPRCAAVVHHGGIGTTAAALRSRKPQLIIPICFDQLDNATRVQQLGCGTFIARHRASARNIARKLKRALELPPADDRSSSNSSGLPGAADVIEDFAGRSFAAGSRSVKA